MKPFSSLFSKILLWFFMNLALVAAVLVVFFAFGSQIDLHAIFGHQASDRLRTAGRLISHELNQAPTANWSDVLARHAEIYQVDFALLFKGGSQSLSKHMDIPEAVMKMVMGAFRTRSPKGEFLQPRKLRDKRGKKHRFMMRTKNPTRYWAGVRIPVSLTPSRPPVRAVLLAVSDSITGNGFFFDPLPWIIVAAAVMLISVLLWLPLLRNITGPLARMTRAAEEIARGGFDVRINEPRADEIGRLANAINHMTSRLCGFVKGQKRFLGDVAHELGSPIARIQIGLGILEHRVDANNRKQVADVMEDVTHMSNLVNELLSFSRAEMDTAKVMLKTVEVLPVLERAVQRESMPATKIITKIDPKIRVMADPELLVRALANIIRNAVKYAGDAGPIHVSAKRQGNKTEIEVRDSGPGVPDDLVEQLFEPFFRPEPSRDRCSGGVGLGLAIVKTCIETCKGTVSARNLKPKGFAVTIILTSDTYTK
ncbi:MAG: two-component system, OmpR family, sensor histidine kinase CpxA [Desulfobacteraceae bacterium Eth-SRB2]|nr:MAG: two-component system, OmpR family, sensor histidine kinase CpxA [Desulfobacteraceae bacterium Eth-SRB2]